jgi:hypothetical protein
MNGTVVVVVVVVVVVAVDDILYNTHITLFTHLRDFAHAEDEVDTRPRRRGTR